MEFYEATLKGMKKLLGDFNEDKYAEIVESCLKKWQSDKDVECMLSEFSDTGRFRAFKFRPADFSSPEQALWTNQLFGGLVAMMIRLGGLILEGQSVGIDFIRSNFGHSSEILTGFKCTSCGKFYTSSIDIEKFISMPIIAKGITDGLEKKNLDDEIDRIMSLSSPSMERERGKAKLRCVNTNIIISDSRLTFCTSCGSKKIEPCRFLKSVKELVYVPLNS